MRHLVLAHRHGVGLVEDDVGGLQHRVAHQAVIDRLLGLVHLPHLFLKGGHAHQPAQGRDHAEEGVQGHDLGDVGLDEDEAPFRIDAGGQPVEDHVVYVRPDDLGVAAGLHGGQGMHVHGAIDAVIVLLQVHPVLQGAHVIAQVQQPGGPHPGERSHRACYCSLLTP